MFIEKLVKEVETTLSRIARYEEAGDRKNAHALRERLLLEAQGASGDKAIEILSGLVHEKTTIGGVAEATAFHNYYAALHQCANEQLGSDHGLTALAKRKLARIFVIQGNYKQAVTLIDEALPVLERAFGADSFEVREALNSQIGWMRYFDPARATATVEREWNTHPLCDHLKPVESYLRSLGAKMRRETSITRPKVIVFVDGCLNQQSIRRKLELPACVVDFDDSGPHSLNSKGFACTVHPHLIAGADRCEPNAPKFD